MNSDPEEEVMSIRSQLSCGNLNLNPFCQRKRKTPPLSYSTQRSTRSKTDSDPGHLEGNPLEVLKTESKILQRTSWGKGKKKRFPAQGCSLETRLSSLRNSQKGPLAKDQTPMMMVETLTRRNNSLSPICPGQTGKETSPQSLTQVARKPSNSSRLSIETSNNPNSSSVSRPAHQGTPPPPN